MLPTALPATPSQAWLAWRAWRQSPLENVSLRPEPVEGQFLFYPFASTFSRPAFLVIGSDP